MQIPFVKTVGLTQNDCGTLCLAITPTVTNHLNTLHASAQFMLAETAAGQLLIDSFPELVGKAIPVLRDAQIKFKRPAESTVTAYASIASSAAEDFLAQLERRGRGSLVVTVNVKDSAEKITCSGVFNWSVHRIE